MSERAGRADRPSAGRRWAGLAGSWALGAVLLAAALLKALDPAAFAAGIAAEGLDRLLAAATVALLAIVLEAALGWLLVLGVRTRGVLAVSSALVVFFLLLTGRAWWRAAHGLEVGDGCSCFGNLVARSPAAAFWQDLVLLVPPLLLAWWGGPPRRVGLARWTAAALGATGVALLAWHAPRLPLDDWATRARPGVEVASLCAGGGQAPRLCLPDVVPELAHGERWVVLVDLAREPEAWVDRLSAWAPTSEVGVVAVTAAEPEEVAAFLWQWGPAFPIREAPAALLRPLHRDLPRSLLVREGVVVLTSPGLPPPAGSAQEIHRP